MKWGKTPINAIFADEGKDDRYVMCRWQMLRWEQKAFLRLRPRPRGACERVSNLTHYGNVDQSHTQADL